MDYRFRPRRGWIVDWGPSLNVRYDFDHAGLRLDTDYLPYFAVQGRGQTLLSSVPMNVCASVCAPRISASTDSAPRRSRNQDYQEHFSAATFQTGYLKKATILASYMWGEGVNFVALPDSVNPAVDPYGHPYLAREDTAQAGLVLRPIKPLKIENTYLFERLRPDRKTLQHVQQSQNPGAGRSILNDHILRSKWNWQFTPAAIRCA